MPAACADRRDVLSGNASLCAGCRHQPLPISIGRAAGAYEGALRQLIHALKYDGRRLLARPLAALLRERCSDALAGADLSVPVPLHWRRRLTRGFNQAEDLARALDLPVSLALRRVRATRPQFGLRLGERRRNVGAAFAPRRNWLKDAATRLLRVRGAGLQPCSNGADAVAGACVVLVDDLATTGATLRECAEVLRGMGAREVRAVTVARALSPRPD